MSVTFTTSATDTSVTITVTAATNLSASGNRVAYTINGVTTSSANFLSADLPVDTVITGLTASTTYSISWTLYTMSGGIEIDTDGGTLSATTKAAGYDTPRVATQEQWEDLATRIKAKADVSSVPSSSGVIIYNPGEDFQANAQTVTGTTRVSLTDAGPQPLVTSVPGVLMVTGWCTLTNINGTGIVTVTVTDTSTQTSSNHRIFTWITNTAGMRSGVRYQLLPAGSYTIDLTAVGDGASATITSTRERGIRWMFLPYPS